VMVSFLEGDPDLPMVAGSFFSTTSRVPHELPGHKTRSSWRSSSSPGSEGANEITFEDAAGRELVYLHAQKGMQTVVRSDRGAVVGGTDSTLVGDKHVVTMTGVRENGAGAPTHFEMIDKRITFTTGEASIVLEGPNVTIEAKGNIVVRSASGDVVIKGGPMVKINGTGASEVAKMLSDPEVVAKLSSYIRYKQRKISDGAAPSAMGKDGPYPVDICAREADIPGKDIHHLQHWWLKTPDFEAGMGPLNAGIPGHGGSDWPFARTSINDHTGESQLPGAICVPAESIDLNWAYEDRQCLMDIMQIGRDSGRWTPNNQCHSVIEEALDKCQLPNPDK
jgi:hypothetical protein